MGVAVYISFDKPIEGLDHLHAVDGKALARSLNTLDAICRKRGVEKFSSFISVDRESALSFLEAEDITDVSVPEEKWFNPSLPLNTVRNIADALRAQGDDGNLPILQELEICERLLMAARKHGVNVHFSVDSP